MAKHKKGSCCTSGILSDLMGIPCNLVAGLVVGLFLPLAALAAIVAGIRLFTGKVPFLARVEQDESGERELSLRLVPPEQVRGLWAEHKKTFGEPLEKLGVEIRAVAEKAKSEGDQPS
jgi:hypothetical protein